MRAFWLALFLCVAACDRNQAAGGSGTGAPREDVTREEARLERERNPKKIVEALKIGPGSRVADIGAGSGLLTVHLARAVAPNGHVVATDIESQVLEYLQQRVAKAGLSEIVESRVVSADSPQLEDGMYDAILLAQVDHYFADGVAWLKAATKALKPHGRIVITNLMHHRTQSMATAQKAGLVVESESTPAPAQFIAVFVPRKK